MNELNEAYDMGMKYPLPTGINTPTVPLSYLSLLLRETKVFWCLNVSRVSNFLDKITTKIQIIVEVLLRNTESIINWWKFCPE